MISCCQKNICIQPLLWVWVQPGWIMMGLNAPLGMGTYLITSTRWTRPVDHWTLCCITDSLQNRSFPSICSFNDEHSKLDVWYMVTRRSWSWIHWQASREVTSTLLYTHGMKVL
jgi:hypothetical protein